jgi:hypothetical protein
MEPITIEIPDGTSLPFEDSDEQLAREFRLAAAIFWHDHGGGGRETRGEQFGQGRVAASTKRARNAHPIRRVDAMQIRVKFCMASGFDR